MPGFVGAKVPVYRDIVVAISRAAPAARRDAIAAAAARAVARVAANDPQLSRPATQELQQRIEAAKSGPPAITPAPTAQGVKLGTMVLYSEAQLAEYYDDNIFATENDKTSDYATVFSPHVFLVSDWQKHALSLQAHVDKTWYKDHTNENSTDYWVSGEGRIDAASDLQFFGGASYGRFHEDRASPDDANGFEPTLYQELKLYGSAWKRVGPHRFRGGATWERTTFDDTLTSTGTINNADRNRNHVTEGVADFYQLNDTFTPFVELGLDQRQYDASTDDAGFDRDSHGYRTKVGTEFKVPGNVDGRVYVGYMHQNYEDAALPSISKPDFGGNFRWRFIPFHPPVGMGVALDRGNDAVGRVWLRADGRRRDASSTISRRMFCWLCGPATTKATTRGQAAPTTNTRRDSGRDTI